MTLLQNRPQFRSGDGATIRRPAADVRNLMTEFKTHRGWLRAVNDVSFTCRAAKCWPSSVNRVPERVRCCARFWAYNRSARLIEGEIVLDGVDLLRLSPRQREDVRGSLSSRWSSRTR